VEWLAEAGTTIIIDSDDWDDFNDVDEFDDFDDFGGSEGFDGDAAGWLGDIAAAVDAGDSAEFMPEPR
jgi:hypothetical protein